MCVRVYLALVLTCLIQILSAIVAIRENLWVHIQCICRFACFSCDGVHCDGRMMVHGVHMCLCVSVCVCVCVWYMCAWVCVCVCVRTGFGLGIALGIFTSMLDPAIAGEPMSGTVGPQAKPMTVKQTAKEIGKRSMGYGKSFGAIGAMFSGTECMLESVGDNDGGGMCGGLVEWWW